MIVEFFGPSGVGKTTLACRLATQLRERGCDVSLALSYRPSEQPRSMADTALARQRMSALRRVARPIVESFRMANHLPADSREAHAAASVETLSAPHTILSVKLHQYMLRLARRWRDAVSACEIVLFDQAFVQAVCTFASLAPVADIERIGAVLDALPQPDLLVRLEAPLTIVESRLAERRRRQSVVERLFELDLETNLRAIEIADRVYDFLQKRDWPMVGVESVDERSLHEAAGTLAESLERMRHATIAQSCVEQNRAT